MSRRQIQLIAILLTAVSVGEIAFAILALGHRHASIANEFSANKSFVTHLAGPCSHHHGHEHFLPVSHTPVPDDSSGSQGSSESDCSICRYLAQLVLPVSWSIDFFSQDLVDVVVQITSFDVATPAHLFPQPRSPPVAV